MRGTTTIEFDFEFEYADGGQHHKAFAITLQAPGFDRYDVHTAMTAWIGKAALGFMANMPERQKPDGAERRQKANGDKTAEEIRAERRSSLTNLAMGLGVDDYQRFATFLRRTLTKNSALARVAETEVGIQDMTWSTIADQGGIEAVEEIMGAFIDFFTESPKSAGATGNT